MNKKLIPFILVAGVVAILVFQYKAIIPFAETVATSDLFLYDSGDEGSRMASQTEMTNYAFIQCNKEIRNEIDDDIQITLPSEPLKSWSLGNYRYLINADIEVTKEDGTSTFYKYACHIEYDEGSNLEGVMDLNNWSMHGLSGLSDL